MYARPEQFEPLIPSAAASAKAGLPALAGDVAARALGLKRMVHPMTEARLAQLLRSVNSYYSNLIEGQQTRPLDIERALRKSFSKEPDKARRQRIAVAHIGAQQEMESWLAAGEVDIYAPDFLSRLHKAFYSRLNEQDRKTPEGDIVVPGAWREKDVEVGNHIPPTHASIAAFLKRAQEVYGAAGGLDGQLIACACAHHRLAWVHPFRDGNGRVIRLQSQAALLKSSVGSGLWAVSRGLARTREDYYARLADADSPRRGDYDGRGNLSESGLVAFARYFLETCLDQVTFMGDMLALDAFRDRLHGYIVLRSAQSKSIRQEAELPLYHVFLAGEVGRGEFKQMTGLASRTADNMLAALLKAGLVESDSPRGPLRFGLPLEALAYYFPRLYPEAAQ
jgi:Fic family protein